MTHDKQTSGCLREVSKMLWGIPVWIWIVFFLSRVFWVVAGAILWVYFFPRLLWNEKIEEKYFGNTLKDRQVKENEREKR